MKHYLQIIIRICLGKLRALFGEKQYCIRKGYRHREEISYFDDTGMKDEWQNEVYEIAERYARDRDYRRVLDIGCGSGFKLVKYFSDYETTGVDINPTYDFLVEKYPDRKWLNAETYDPSSTSTDILICSDVIEHVKDPDQLLADLNKIDFKLLFLSTPERLIWSGWYDYGPPRNPAHIREWNGKELYAYLSKHFDVLSHQVTNYQQATQMLVCSKKTE